MAKTTQKLSAAQKRAKKKAKEKRQKRYMWVFMNGKQVRVKRPEMVDGVDSDEYIRNNADPIWLHQNEMWEYMEPEKDDDEDMDSYIYNYCGQWKDSEGNILLIEPMNERHVYVTYIRAGENAPLLRPWLGNTPATNMIGSYNPELGPSLDIELSKQGDGFCLSLDFHFQVGNYNKILSSICRNEEDSHLDKYYYLFGKLGSYFKQDELAR
jgi:hypothetical protein